MSEFKSTRTAMGEALVELAEAGMDIVAIAADTSKSMNTHLLKENFPDRTYDCGIAEQDMVMIAAGLATTGKIVFAASYSTFMSMRVLEQLRTFVCYPNLNVKFIAGLSGLTGSIEGATHISLEDFGIMRCIPNIVILNPADYYSTKKAAYEAAKISTPCYIRVGRDASPVIFNEDYSLTIGKANIIIDEGDDVGIITSGLILSEVISAAQRLKKMGIKIKLLEMPTLKPIDKEAVINLAKSTNKIFTIEEHNVTGALYSAVCEVLCSNYPKYVYPIATPDIFSDSGSLKQLLELYGLDAASIVERINSVLKR